MNNLSFKEIENNEAEVNNSSALIPYAGDVGFDHALKTSGSNENGAGEESSAITPETEYAPSPTHDEDQDRLALVLVPESAITDHPVVIKLEKNVRGSNGDSVHGNLSLKLPKVYLEQMGLREPSPATARGSKSARKESDAETTKLLFKRINFHLPDDIYQAISFLDAEYPADNTPVLDERLEGWEVRQVTRRDGKRFDRTFHHGKVSTQFRSFPEVETYIIHGGRKKHVSKKRKLPRDETQQEVSSEEFLKDAWTNLQNMHMGK